MSTGTTITILPTGEGTCTQWHAVYSEILGVGTEACSPRAESQLQSTDPIIYEKLLNTLNGH